MSLSSRPSDTGARRPGQPPVTGPNRLPGGRERRPALAALAVILILLGAAGSALIALRSGDRQDYIAVEGVLEPGHKIERKDLARGDLAGATGGLVPWADVDKYVGRYTTTRLYKGQFVTKDNFTPGTTPDVPTGGALVGVNLEGGRVPSDGVQAGDIVRVIRVPAASNEGGTAEVLVGAAEVTDSAGGVADAKTNASTTLNATILVPLDKSTRVASAAAAKTLVLLKLSSGIKPEVSRNNGDG